MIREIDLHVVVILIFLVPLSLLVLPLKWALLGIAGVPQGRLLARAFWDYPRFNKPMAPYLIANEGLIVLILAVCLVGWDLMH